MVERILGKDEVTGSIPVSSSKKKHVLLGSVSFCVCVRKDTTSFASSLATSFSRRLTSFRISGHKTMLPYGKQCCASHKRCDALHQRCYTLRCKRCGYANDVLPLAKTMLRLRRNYTICVRCCALRKFIVCPNLLIIFR